MTGGVDDGKAMGAGTSRVRMASGFRRVRPARLHVCHPEAEQVIASTGMDAAVKPRHDSSGPRSSRGEAAGTMGRSHCGPEAPVLVLSGHGWLAER
jgi:hypothetical protein